MKYKTLATLGLTLTAMMMLYACAKQGYPTGGPKDETPPVVLGTTPLNGTTNFDAKEFYILFDEYVQVKSADENILVSPPMKHKPEYTTKGRGILVKIKDTLRENTTYLFQFKEGIADFNEGNALKSFEYVFSTGSHIDSMTLRGWVLDAFTGEPWKETVTVVAYHANSDTMTQLTPSGDSVAAKEQPLYMTRCDKEGHFELNHLREGSYLLLAYEDGDKNLRLGTDEAVAFLDTLVMAQKMPAPIDTTTKDSTMSDSTATADSALTADTLATTLDTIPTPTDSLPTVNPIQRVTMLMSILKKETQRVTKSEFKKKGQIEIVTQCPLTDSFAIRPLHDSLEDLYYRRNRTGDTLRIWTAQESCDSITLLLTDTIIAQSENSNLRDTLKLQFCEKNAPKPSMPVPGLKSSILKNLVAGSHPYFDTLWVGFENPIADSMATNLDSVVRVFNLTDSSISYCGMTLAHDLHPSGSSRAMIDFSGKAGEKYRFTILPKCFTDIYGHSNTDSIHINTEYTKVENYGNIFLDVEIDQPADSTVNAVRLLIQPTHEKGDTLQQRIITESGRLTFPNLKGGKYGFRAIVDTDGNGEWTPGDYWVGRQPERIILFEKTLELRENWDMEEKWKIDN